MAKIFSVDAPGTTKNPVYNFLNESAPGAGDGTALKAEHSMEVLATFMHLMLDAGYTYSDALEQAVPDAAANRQFYDALQLFCRANSGGFIGSIGMSPVVAIPANHLACNGAAVSRTTYDKLFAAIGTLHGSGDGSTTFNVPDYRGVFMRGTGTHGTLLLANGGAVAGPAVAAFQNDMMQGHLHNALIDGTGAGAGEMGIQGADSASASISVPKTDVAISDGTNGTPRTGAETRPFSAGVTFVIRYQ